MHIAEKANDENASQHDLGFSDVIL